MNHDTPTNLHGPRPRQTSSATRSRTRLVGAASTGACALLLGGCVAIMISSADYEPIELNLSTKAEVQAALGEPARRTTSADTETWYYRLQADGLAGKAVNSTLSGGALIIPAFSTTTYEDNLKFEFAQDRLRAAHERFARESATGCFIGHGIQLRCGAEGPAGSPSSSTAVGGHPPHPNEALHVFAVHDLPADCTTPAETPPTAACLVGRFLRARSLPLARASIRVLDRRTYFSVIPAEGSNAADIGYAEIRVTKRSGVVAAWGRQDTRSHRTPA